MRRLSELDDNLGRAEGHSERKDRILSESYDMTSTA